MTIVDNFIMQDSVVFKSVKLRLHDAIYRLRFYSDSLIHILSNSHNNVASIQKNRGDKSHRLIIALQGLTRLICMELPREYKLHLSPKKLLGAKGHGEKCIKVRFLLLSRHILRNFLLLYPFTSPPSFQSIILIW